MTGTACSALLLTDFFSGSPFVVDVERKEHFKKLTPEERPEALESRPPEERRQVLQSPPPEERLAGLSAEQIRQYLGQLTARSSLGERKPRRKK